MQGRAWTSKLSSRSSCGSTWSGWPYRWKVKHLPGGRDLIRKEIAALGKASPEEKIAIAASIVLVLVLTITERGGCILGPPGVLQVAAISLPGSAAGPVLRR